jgi:hypothetical protein
MSLFPLFPLFPLFSYFHNLVQKLFLLGFYESAGTTGTTGTVIFYKLPARRTFGHFICKKLPVAFIPTNISTKTIKYSIYAEYFD